jgi:hypothetical protein
MAMAMAEHTHCIAPARIYASVAARANRWALQLLRHRRGEEQLGREEDDDVTSRGYTLCLLSVTLLCNPEFQNSW